MVEGKNMAVSKYVAPIGMVIIAVVAFAIGLYASPLIFPAKEPPKAPEDPVWARVSNSSRIIVATEPGWPPYEFLNATGGVVGFEIELMEMIADELNLTVEWRTNIPFDSIIPAVEAMDVDLGVSGFSVYIDRLEVIQYTMPHSITEGQVIMLQSRANALGITTLTSLANLTQLGLKCAAQSGTTQADELSEVAPGSLRIYTDYLLALDDMKRGAIDAVYAETPITSNWIFEAEQHGEPPIIVVYRRPYYPVAFVARKDADTLVAKINGVLAEKIIATAKLDQLKQKWKC